LEGLKNLMEEISMSQDTLYSSKDAAEFLNLSVISFSKYEVKSNICYQLITGRRMYTQKELERFRREVLQNNSE
jgi:hypothetical protein